MQRCRILGDMLRAGMITSLLWLEVLTPLQGVQSQAVAAEAAGSASCLNALIAAQQQIRSGRDLQLRSELGTLFNRYPDHPVTRPHEVRLIFSGQTARDVIASNVLQASISSSIVRNCDSVGLVTFGVDRTESLKSFGWMNDGSVRAFDCIEPSRDAPPLIWGRQFC